MGLVNHPRIPKMWAIAHENGPKMQKDVFLVMPLKHVLGVIDLVNHSAAPKLWAIIHKYGHKRINDDFFLIPL
jgi:hypothetical protein